METDFRFFYNNKKDGGFVKISTKSRYAIRLLVELVKAENLEQPMPLKQIAKNQGISANYVESISSKLTRAGYITSFKGVNGGYLLAKDPHSISVGEIMRLMESTYFESHCIKNADINCPNFNKCSICKTWDTLEATISNVVDGVSIYQLATEDNDHSHEADIH